MSDKPSLSFWERGSLIFVYARVFIRTILAAILAPFRGSNGSEKFQDHVFLTFGRSFVEEATDRQLCYLMPSMHETYTAFAKKEGFEPKWEVLPSGNKAYWLGDPAAKRTIIYFHGGGYALPIGPFHLTFLNHILQHTPDTSLLLLHYDLSWKSAYPTQLRQAVELLTHTLTTLGRSPSSLTLGGDSAGGNLTLGVISHILHPHPKLPKLEISSPMAAAILISPWTFETHRDSHRTKAKMDIISKDICERFSSNLLDGQKWDGWNEPLSGGEGWWDGIENVVKEVFINAGADEILVDNIKVLIKVLEQTHPKVTSIVAEGEWHCTMTQPYPADPRNTSRDAIVAFCNSRL